MTQWKANKFPRAFLATLKMTPCQSEIDSSICCSSFGFSSEVAKTIQTRFHAPCWQEALRVTVLMANGIFPNGQQHCGWLSSCWIVLFATNFGTMFESHSNDDLIQRRKHDNYTAICKISPTVLLQAGKQFSSTVPTRPPTEIGQHRYSCLWEQIKQCNLLIQVAPG